MAYVIAEPCIGTKDTACIDACPVDCIHPKKDEPNFAEHNMIYIDPVECIDCGACVPVCPVSAIFALDDLPEKWSNFTKINADYFGRGKYRAYGFRHKYVARAGKSLSWCPFPKPGSQRCAPAPRSSIQR